ncbi:MAG: glycosyl transferase [Sphingobacteriia bacterium]|nr:MAG: glycosyl transferase [Sphingobacteriia bacterium]
MRVAHLIVTYTNPAQTERMIRQMHDPDFDFYIHVDAKLPITGHEYLTQIPNVYLIKNRIKVQWAAFSTMQAVFNSLQEILDSARTYDFICLMSGQDYPIKSVEQMKVFFTERKGKLLMKYRAFEGEWEEGMERVNKIFLTNFKFKGQYLIERLLNWFSPKRKLPEGMKFYGSSMFWALSPEAVEYVLNTVNRDERMKRFFYFTWASDEFLFQTVLLNSHFASQVMNENCHYYKHPPKTPSPKTFTKSDFADIMSSDRIYARKFDLLKSPALLDQIDAVIKDNLI